MARFECEGVKGPFTMESDRLPDIRVLADHRERQSGVIEFLRALPDTRIDVGHLPLGDYRVDDRLLFERKTLIDLAASIASGRLFTQACRLAAAEETAVIVLEGSSSDLARSGMRREAIQGALINLSVILGLPVLRSFGPEETARLIVYTARQMRVSISGAVARKGRRPRGKRRSQLEILQALPGVGPARAEALLDRFGSIENVLSAAPEDLRQVAGIGAQTAARIRWVVSEDEVEYGKRRRFKSTAGI